MAYRRKHGTPKASTFEDFPSSFSVAGDDYASTPTSLAAQAIRASAAHRDSSLSSAYVDSTFSSAVRDPRSNRSASFNQSPIRHDFASTRSMNERNSNESKYGFWGVLARKAKSILEEDDDSHQINDQSRNESKMPDTSRGSQFIHYNQSSENNRKAENLASSLNYIGGTIKNAFEEGLTIVENRTADIIQETKKLQIRRKSVSFNPRNQVSGVAATESLSQNLADQENQLKSSRDLANAMAAKAKLLLRELKTVKADLAFAKERGAQLEEENKLLRENREKGDNTEDDDLISLQLETLLAEKGRLAHENSIYARENRFLREIVEYHQLTMQDVLYLDDHIMDVAEVVSSVQISSPHSSSHSTSEVLSPAISSPHSPTTVPNSPTSLTINFEPESSSPSAPA